MFQYLLDHMNEELTWELKTAHQRITKLEADDGDRTRLAVGGTFAMAAKVLLGMQMDDPRVVDAQFALPPRV